MLLDTTLDIETPERVGRHLPLAGLAARSLAWLLDFAIKCGAMLVVGTAIGLRGGLGTESMLLLAFLGLWFYNVLFEIFNRGSTPGKRAFGLRVMNANGTPVAWRGSLLRNLVRAVDVLPGCYLFGCGSVLLSPRFQRIGDLVAGTIVVYEPDAKAAGALATVAPLPVHIPLAPDEQQAIVSYAERAPRLNPARAEELAVVLQPVFGDIDATRLKRHAAWLAANFSLTGRHEP